MTGYRFRIGVRRFITFRKEIDPSESKSLMGNGFGARLAFVILLLVCGIPKIAVAEKNATSIGTPKVGWNGHYLVGRWTRVVVPVTIAESSIPVQLELTALDSDGNRVHFRSTEFDAVKQQLTGFIKVGRLNGDVSIRVNQETELRGVPGGTEWLKLPLKPSTQLIVTVGDPQGFDFDTDSSIQGVKVARMKAEDLPTNPLAYDGVSFLVIAGTNEFSQAQVKALKNWVAGGGRMLLSLHQNSELADRSIQQFAYWLPISVGKQPVTVREFASLATFARKNIGIPQTSTLSIPNLQSADGEVLAASRSDAFLVQAPYGMGSASTVLAMDLRAAPLREWKALASSRLQPDLCQRCAPTSDASDKGHSKGAQLSSTGITDLATQLNATQDRFESLDRASPWFVMGLLLGLLFIVGPLDYVFVHRILKKPHFTWISYPLLVAASGLFASWLANSSNGSARHANQLDIVTIDATTDVTTARVAGVAGRHFVTLYSPTTTQSAIDVKPMPLNNHSKVAPSSSIVWQGIPETTFGGMLRETSLEQGADYQHQSDGGLTNLPLIQWSSKALVAESTQPVEGLVDCNLKASATGRLTGTIIHRLPVAIEDWILVYKNVVYRSLKQKDDPQSIALPPNQTWHVDQSRVFTRELRPYMTGAITMATPRFGQTNVTDHAHRQTNYDVLSRDPANLVRTLTFHDEIGAERYTGLTNQILDNEDCSLPLRLGRAILFGRIDRPVSVVIGNRITPRLRPDRQTTFVRPDPFRSHGPRKSSRNFSEFFNSNESDLMEGVSPLFCARRF